MQKNYVVVPEKGPAVFSQLACVDSDENQSRVWRRTLVFVHEIDE